MEYPLRSFGRALDGREICIPVYGDITPEEELAVIELNDAYLEDGEIASGKKAVHYRVAQASMLLTSRVSAEYTPEVVQKLLFRRQVDAIISFLAEELTGASLVPPEDSPPPEPVTKKPSESSGRRGNGKSSDISHSTDVSVDGGTGDSPGG